MEFYQFCLMASIVWGAQANAGDKKFANLATTIWLLLSLAAWVFNK
jgi:hypothetical protein